MKKASFYSMLLNIYAHWADISLRKSRSYSRMRHCITAAQRDQTTSLLIGILTMYIIY